MKRVIVATTTICLLLGVVSSTSDGEPTSSNGVYGPSFHQGQQQILADPYAFINSYSFASAGGDAMVTASASNVYSGMQNFYESLIEQQQQYQASLAGYFEQLNSQYNGIPNSAIASASVGPNGGYQTAAIYPENPASPNIYNSYSPPAIPPYGSYSDNANTFNEYPGPMGPYAGFSGIPNSFNDYSAQGPGDFKSVSVSSSSSSSNINGVQTNHRHSETTINDNGKVSHFERRD